MKTIQTLALAGAAFIASGAANAGIVDEGRIGITQHNICVLDCDNADKEDGPNVSAEIAFTSPDFLSWAFSPRPYLTASINTAGKTSFAGGGLEWSIPVGDSFAIEPGLGYVFHDGSNSNPFPNGDPRAVTFSDENVLMGSDDLFRTSLGLTWNINETFGAQILYEHYSHGQILGEGRNQGMDNLGVRLVYNFD